MPGWLLRAGWRKTALTNTSCWWMQGRRVRMRLGRNSGFAIDLPHNVGSSLDELDGSHRFMRLARYAISQS